MYAIIVSGGKQYTVREGEYVDLEKLDANVGDKVNLDVALYSTEDGKVEIGHDILSNVKCEAEVVKQDKTSKIIVFKYKAKKNVRSRQGHRQPYTRVKILSIKKA